MPALINLIGQKFGRWTVIDGPIRRQKPNGKFRIFWLCRCACNNEKEVPSNNLKIGKSKSCGCLNSDLRSKRFTEMNLTHGHSYRKGRSKAYDAWAHMIQRCDNPNVEKYPRYGGRGITYDEQWKIFENFLEDMGEPPKGYTLDRINSNGNYEKSNCRWATIIQQANNRSNNRFLTYRGKRQTVAMWARELNINPITIRSRLNRGLSDSEALTLPIKNGRTVQLNIF